MSLTLAPAIQSQYKLLERKWCDCSRCPLSRTRRRVVQCRGTLPCDVLFIGEAPGESEDMFGWPFWGPAGKLFDDIIQEAQVGVGMTSSTEAYKAEVLTYALINVVGCWPKDPSDTSSGEGRAPNKEEILACQPRVVDLIKLARPRMIISVGDIARRNIPRPLPGHPFEGHILHPAAILHQGNVSSQDLDYKRTVLTLTNHLRFLLEATHA